jgi:thiosulfate dehydrogenase (quinone) large subunit
MNKPCCDCDPRAAAVALGRWGLGVVLLLAGIGKLGDVPGFVNGFLVPAFKETWLPKPLVTGYGYALPFLEVGLGALLILGLFRNAVLFAAGLLLISLAFGQLLLKKPEVIGNVTYVFFAAAVLFAGQHDRWILGPKRDATERRDPPA